MAATIDIDKILKDKMGRRARYVPAFVTAYLRHIVHQDWANAFLIRAADKQGTAWLVDCLDYLGITLEIDGLDRLPRADTGRRYTFVSNHPLGGVDGVALGTIIGRRYGDNFKYLVNDLLMNLPGLAPLCVPINKTGSNGRAFPQLVERTFASPDHILMFPAGLCSRKINGVIHDLPWKKTFITKSRSTGRDIVPIYFEGRNSDFFYNLATWSRRLGIKFNIAMLFLADELYKNCNKTYRVTIGDPIPTGTFDSSRTPSEWADEVCRQVYALAERNKKQE